MTEKQQTKEVEIWLRLPLSWKLEILKLSNELGEAMSVVARGFIREGLQRLGRLPEPGPLDQDGA